MCNQPQMHQRLCHHQRVLLTGTTCNNLSLAHHLCQRGVTLPPYFTMMLWDFNLCKLLGNPCITGTIPKSCTTYMSLLCPVSLVSYYSSLLEAQWKHTSPLQILSPYTCQTLFSLCFPCLNGDGINIPPFCLHPCPFNNIFMYCCHHSAGTSYAEITTDAKISRSTNGIS